MFFGTCTGTRVTFVYRHVQGVGDQTGAHVVINGETDHGSRVEVDHSGHVGPALPRANVGDVAAPFLVRLLGAELPANQVRR